MDSYRLYLWNADAGLAERTIDDADAAPLLDRLDRIGRQAVHRTIGHPPAHPLPPAKLARARHLLRIARRLLDEVGEHDAAAGAIRSLIRIRQS